MAEGRPGQIPAAVTTALWGFEAEVRKTHIFAGIATDNPTDMAGTSEPPADKQRIVFAGSEGGELIAAICAHVLGFLKRPFDFVIGGEPVRQHQDAPMALIVASESIHREGQPDFLTYHHHIGVIAAIQFQEGKGFSSEDAYIRQYDQFADATPKGGLLVYSELDPVASVLCNKERPDVAYVPFKSHPHAEENGQHFLTDNHHGRIPVKLRSRHDLPYFSAARELLKKLGVTTDMFYQAIPSFNPS